MICEGLGGMGSGICEVGDEDWWVCECVWRLEIVGNGVCEVRDEDWWSLEMVGEEKNGGLWFCVVVNDEDEERKPIFGTYGSLDIVMVEIMKAWC
jgi:hypothetical protein